MTAVVSREAAASQAALRASILFYTLDDAPNFARSDGSFRAMLMNIFNTIIAQRCNGEKQLRQLKYPEVHGNN